MRGAASSALARGIRWRLMGSVLVVITSAIAVGTAVVGPLFLRAGGDSLVRQAVGDASALKTRLALTPAHRASTLDGLVAEQRSLLGADHLTGLYESAVVKTMLSTVLVTSANRGEVYLGRLTYRSGICSVLHFSSGGCRSDPRDAVVSDRSARELGVSVGSTLTVNDRKGEVPVQLRITGVYQLPNLQSSYWFGEPQAYFTFGVFSGKPLELDGVDDLFVASPSALGLPSAYSRSVAIQTGLRQGVLGIGNASTVQRQMLALQHRATREGFELESGLQALLAGPLHQRSLMNTVVVVAAVQLVLLAIWVLTSALMRSADLRRAELRIARLRGFPFSTLLAVSVTEPAALCAIGVVLGILGAWGVVLAASSILFTSGTTVGLDGWTVVGFGAVVLTIAAVLGLSSLRLLRSQGLVASRQSAGSRSRVAIDVSILALSAIAVIGASTSGALSSHSNPVAAAAPAFVALGASVIAIRIVEYLCRRLSAATLDSPAVAIFLAVRQIGRRPTALREGRTLVIAVALACFAVSAWSVARENRRTAASFSIGADTVVTVDAGHRPLEKAVDMVDPQGRFAMAAVQVAGPGTPLVGLDASRLGAVAAWPRGTTRESVAEVSRALTAKRLPGFELADGALEVSADVSASLPASGALGRLYLAAWLFDPRDGTFTADLGRLRSGAYTYKGVAHPDCPCRLVGLGVLPGATSVPDSGSIHVAVSGLHYRSATAAPDGSPAVLDAANWRSSVEGIRVGTTGSQLAIAVPMKVVAEDVGAGGVSPVMASVAAPPSVLPAVVGSFAESLAGEEGTVSVQGLDGYNITAGPAAAAASLPRIGSGGAIVDLPTLERFQAGPTSSETSEEVWLGGRAPADAVSRLRAAGLQIEDVQRSSTLIKQSAHSGPALAYDFMLLATIVALLVAAVGTFSVLAAGGRGRATEMVALEVTGVPRGILTRSLAFEAGILAVTALFGVAAGAASAAIALPSLPQLGAHTDAPLSYALPVLLLLAAAAGAVLVVMAATALAARGILTSMSPTLLRNAADDVD